MNKYGLSSSTNDGTMPETTPARKTAVDTNGNIGNDFKGGFQPMLRPDEKREAPVPFDFK